MFQFVHIYLMVEMYTGPPGHCYQILWRAGNNYFLSAQPADMKTTTVYTKKPFWLLKTWKGYYTANRPIWLLSISALIQPMINLLIFQFISYYK